MQMLSAHFSYEELTRSDTASRLGLNNTPQEEALAHLKLVADALELIRHELGKPLIVTSGYRSPELNKLTPGSSVHSAHMLGYAADFHCKSLSPLALCELVLGIKSLRFNQLIYEFDSWCHLDVNPLGRHQVMTKACGKPMLEGLCSSPHRAVLDNNGG